MKWAFTTKKPRVEGVGTRKKKKDDVFSVSTDVPEKLTKIEETCENK
jgi:hypothetical protein